MTQEEKRLLIKDMCARIPDGLKVLYNDSLECQPSGVVKVNNKTYFMAFGVSLPLELDKIKPYLRPMSSMTEDEKKEYNSYHSHPDNIGDSPWFYVDWLNEKMFDYRGLIPMGLALPATERMYTKI